MRTPPITITCDCGTVGRVTFGHQWCCDTCGRTYDTTQIPPEELDAVLRDMKRYRLLALGPPLVLVAVLLPLAIFVGIRFAFLLFILLLADALLVLPPLRRRATVRLRSAAPRWELRPEEPTVS